MHFHAVENGILHLVERQAITPACRKRFFPSDLKITHAQATRLPNGQRRGGVFVGGAGIGRHKELYIVQSYTLEPTVRMSVDYGGAYAVSNDVLNDDVANLAGGRLVGALGSVHFTAPLDVEMEGIAIAPPKPIEAPSLDGNVGQDHIFDNAAIE